MRFTLRDLLWLTVVVALALGWVDPTGRLGLADAGGTTPRNGANGDAVGW